MITLEAPIIPGESAAGIRLGQEASDLLSDESVKFSIQTTSVPNSVIYRSQNVDVWAKNNAIDQIMVHGSYWGKINGEVGIGTPIKTAAQILGQLEEDEENNLIFHNISGLCVEIDVDSNPSPIVEIYIFDPPLLQK